MLMTTRLPEPTLEEWDDALLGELDQSTSVCEDEVRTTSPARSQASVATLVTGVLLLVGAVLPWAADQGDVHQFGGIEMGDTSVVLFALVASAGALLVTAGLRRWRRAPWLSLAAPILAVATPVIAHADAAHVFANAGLDAAGAHLGVGVTVIAMGGIVALISLTARLDGRRD